MAKKEKHTDKHIDNENVMKNFDPNMIKAIAIDIDGTLVNENIECSPRTVDAVKQLIATDREVYIVTGRGTSTAMPFAQQCGIPKHMINFNGATIWDFQENKAIFESCIGIKEAIDILRIVRQNEVLAIVYSDHEFYYELENDVLENYLKRISVPGSKMSLEELPLNSFLKVLIMADDKQIKSIYKELLDLHQDNLYAIITTPGINKDTNALCIEIMSKEVNKGKTLDKLVSSKGFSLEDTIAFGDDTNDVEMLSMVGWGVAMGNARPHVKEVARLETLPNSQDGVAYFIEKFLL